MKRKRRTRFITWCKKDPDDERKINYTFKHANGFVSHFTSDDELPLNLFLKVQNAWIESVELINNDLENSAGEWCIILYEDV